LTITRQHQATVFIVTLIPTTKQRAQEDYYGSQLFEFYVLAWNLMMFPETILDLTPCYLIADSHL
jgi:hypothetical protein